jgi:hypothetical protein
MPKLVFKLMTLNSIFWIGYPYNVLPHNCTNLDTKCWGSKSFFAKEKSKKYFDVIQTHD